MCKLRYIVTLAIAAMGILTVNAQEKNTISVADLKMQRGAEAPLCISMDNLSEVVAVQFTLETSDGITINPVSAIATNRAADHMVTARKTGENTYMIVMLSPTNTPIKGIKGELIKVNVASSDSLEEDTSYPVIIKDAVMSVTSGENIIQETVDGNISLVSLPNLHVTSLNCTESVAGSDMTVSWTVKNDGRGHTNNTEWKDYIWLVPDIQGGTSMKGAKLLKTVDNISALAPGESYDNAVNITLEERVYGNFDVVVTADMPNVKNLELSSCGGTLPRPYSPAISGYIYAETEASGNKVDEENETPTRTDNFFYKGIEIVVPPLADLQVPKVTVVVDNDESYSGEMSDPSPLTASGLASSTAFYSGKKIRVTATIKNGGGASTGNKTINNILYLSDSSEKESGKWIKLNANSSTISIAPDETVDVFFTGKIPYDWYGDAFFYVNVDVNDEVYELANTANNWGCSNAVNVLMTPGADFQPTTIKVPSTVSANSNFDVSYSVSNIGPGVPFASNWVDKLYLAPSNEGLDNNATLIGTISRSGSYKKDGNKYAYTGDDYSLSYNINPSEFTPGSYYIYLVVDADNSIFEYDGEDNNIICSSRIDVLSTDIAAELVSVSEEKLNTGDNAAITWKIKNIGQSNISNVNITDGIYVETGGSGTNNILISEISNVISIPVGGEKTFRANVIIPDNKLLSGQKNIVVKSNIKGTLAESNSSNNTSNGILTSFEYISVESPEDKSVNGTNLTAYGLTVPTEAEVGSAIPVSYSIKNTGTTIIDTDITQSLYLTKKNSSTSIPVSSSADLSAVKGLESSANVPVSFNVNIPTDICGGQYYVNVAVNPTKTLKEKDYSDNSVKNTVFISGNLPDLTITDLAVPSEINTSESTEISFKISNIGSWDATGITCKVYLSSDNILDKKDTQLELFSVERIAKSSSILKTLPITVPDGVTGLRYIIIETSNGGGIEELDWDNNKISAQFTSVQSPLPNLTISELKVAGDVIAGGTVAVKAKVINNGTAPTHKDKWADGFYLCEDYNFDQNTTLSLGSKAHVGVLQPGESYEINASLKVPTTAQGYYVLYAIADVKETVYETNRVDNRIRTTVLVDNPSATPVDIAVAKVSAPAHIKAGEAITISYTIENQSDKQVSGMLRDVIYMSKDKNLDADDPMVGVVFGEETIEPGNNIVREATGRITNMVEGDYYIIVKCNSSRSIVESDFENNIKVADAVTGLDYARLSLGESVSLSTSGLYKLSVNDAVASKTIGIGLTHPEDSPASVYVAFESTPTTAKFDRKSAVFENGQEEVLIPDVKPGTYYILAQANNALNKNLNEFKLNGSETDDDVPMTLTSREVQFGATSLAIKEGGNGGWISTDVRGALLDSIMDFRLVKGDRIIPVESLTFYDQTSTKSIFNLKDAETGQYDMISELPDGTRATLSNAFSVVPGTEVGLGVKLEGPKTTRLNGASPISLSYANGGNTDVSICELFLVVEGGNIAMSIEGLKEGKQELHLVPDTGIDSRGYATISPGTQRTINLFLQQTSGWTHVYLYVIK